MNPNAPISTIMTRELTTVTEDATLAHVKKIFEKHHFHHLPVVKEGQRLVGIISKEDFSRTAYMVSLNTGGKTFSKLEYTHISAKSMMTTYPVFLEPEDTIDLAADIFLANKFHALPILDDGQLVGIVTTHDLIRYAFSEVESENAAEGVNQF
ncbi:MAG: CBS domain-containing protein [Lewinella sp.]|nr:CBS domain-containing protein [Lewinella sp.]